ncbi:MAG: hypothetical protein R2939_14710 [Kofleriaceae bacterium]
MATPARPTDDRLREVYDLVCARIEDRWGIPVVIADVPTPFTGDLDGAEIKVDHDNDLENALFIVIHLFGHTVQWNVSPRAREIGLANRTDYAEHELAEVEAYERTACAYSLQLLHDCGVFDLDPWVSDFAACDAAYLMHFYRTGEKREFREFWRDGAPLVTPLPVPDFTPQKWLSRWNGIVL